MRYYDQGMMGWDDDRDAMQGGEDIEEIVGANSPLMLRPPTAAAPGAAAAWGPRLQTIQKQRWREIILPISSSGTVAASTQATIQAQPQELFRVQRLVVDSTLGANFTIQDFKVGQRSQFVNPGSVPASMFSQLAVGVTLRGDTARVGNLVSLVVTNTDGGAAHAFSAGITGTSLL